jgi:hypothetical protein
MHIPRVLTVKRSHSSASTFEIHSVVDPSPPGADVARKTTFR